MKEPSASDVPFDVSVVPKISREQAQQESARKSITIRFPRVPERNVAVPLGPSALETAHTLAPPKATASTVATPTPAETQSTYAKQLAEVPEFASYGSVLNSSGKPQSLTENETEYVVSCVKHIFREHVVFQVRSNFVFCLIFIQTPVSSVQCIQYSFGHCSGIRFCPYDRRL